MTCFVCKEKKPELFCEITREMICNKCCLELQINKKSNAWKKFFNEFSKVNYLEGDSFSVNLSDKFDYYYYTLSKCLSCQNLVKNEPVINNKENTKEYEETSNLISLASFSYRGGFVHSHHPSFIPYKAAVLINRKGTYTARDYLELGEMYLQINKNKESVQAFKNSLELKEDGYTYLQLAKAYHITEDFENAALYYYNSISSLDSSKLLYEKLKDIEKIEKFYKNMQQKKEKKILEKFEKEINKLESETYRGLGSICRVSNEPEKALLYLKKALKLNTTCNTTLLELAFVYFFMDKYEKVINYTEQLIKKNAVAIKNVKISCYKSMLEEYKNLKHSSKELEKQFSSLISKNYKSYYEVIINSALCLHATTNLNYSNIIEEIHEAETAISIASFISPNDNRLKKIKTMTQKFIFELESELENENIKDNINTNSKESKSKVPKKIIDALINYIAENLNTLMKKEQFFRLGWAKI